MSRSISVSSNLSLNKLNQGSGSATPSGPIAAAHLAMNRRGSAKDSLYHVCLNLIKRLQKVPGMELYLSVAKANAEVAVEQQSLALDQLENSQNNDSRKSSGTSLWHNSGSGSANGGIAGTTDTDSTLTFAAGRLPTQVDCDPVTMVSKLIEQGAPLCLIYNSLNLEDQIEYVQSSEINRCKRNVLNFIVHSKQTLDIPDFTVSDVFSKNTSDLLKIINAINIVLDTDATKYPRIDEVKEIPPVDARSNVVREIIDSERKYVQDLEILLQYKQELEDKEIISSETIRALFPNLNEIVDFQRKFLVGLEVNATVDEEFQRIGSVILHAASHPFKAYSPWSVGQVAAIDLINREYMSLKASSTLIDAPYELQSFLIKPIQRLCKYPLLFQELQKVSNPKFPNKRELDRALLVAKEVANSVNELQRRAENEDVKRDLVMRVRDWRGYSIDNFGELLYHATLGVTDAGSEREFQVYLMEKIVFFFKEILPQQKKNILANRKKSSASLNNSTTSLLAAGNQGLNEYELKGRIFINNIEEVRTSNQVNGNSGYFLTISWTGTKDSGTFLLKFRTEEVRSQWELCLNNLLENLHPSAGSIRNSYDDLKLSPITGSQSSSVRNSFHEQFINSAKHLRSSSHAYSGLQSQSQQRQNSYSGPVQQLSHVPPLPQPLQQARQSIMEDKKYRSVSSPMVLNNNNNGGAGSGTRTSDSFNSMMTSMNGLQLSSSNSPPTSASQVEEEIRLEINYNHEKYHLSVPHNINFINLKLTLLKYLENNRLLIDTANTNIRLRYQDDDEDFVALDGSDDWVIAKDMLDDMEDEEKMLTVLIIQ